MIQMFIERLYKYLKFQILTIYGAISLKICL